MPKYNDPPDHCAHVLDWLASRSGCAGKSYAQWDVTWQYWAWRSGLIPYPDEEVYDA